MNCKYCHTENDDGAVFCIECGKRIDGKRICPICGKAQKEEFAFCPDCGARMNEKTVCKKCGNVFEGKCCPACGTDAMFSRDEKTERIPNATSQTVHFSESRAGAAKPLPTLVHLAKTQSAERKALGITSGVFALAAATVCFVFAFLFGLNANGFGASRSAIGLEYFFADGWGEAVDYFRSSNNFFPLLIMAAGVVAVAAMLAVSFGYFVKISVVAVKALRDGRSVDLLEYAIPPYIAYLVCSFAVRSLFAAKIDLIGGGGEGFDWTRFDPVTVSGLIVSSAMILVSFVCRLIAVKGKREKTKRLIIGGLSIVCTIVLMYFISGPLFGIGNDGNPLTMFSLPMMLTLRPDLIPYPYLGFTIVFLLICSIASVLVVLGLLGALLSRNLLNCVMPRNRHCDSIFGLSLAAAIFCAIPYIFAILILTAAEGPVDEVVFYPLIVGTVLALANCGLAVAQKILD